MRDFQSFAFGVVIKLRGISAPAEQSREIFEAEDEKKGGGMKKKALIGAEQTELIAFVKSSALSLFSLGACIV